MRLVRAARADGTPLVGLLENEQVTPLDVGPGRPLATLSEILESDDPADTVSQLARTAGAPIPLAVARLLAPIDRQEVWAAGVTYKRSRAARMEESEGAASFYDKVYVADRPELFFKANPHRVAGPGQPVRIRRDARWNVPEPELALVINSRRELVGFTIGNDMSSRDIEGENPLYLPQAKVYDACCGLGPAILLNAPGLSLREAPIELSIRRDDRLAFAGQTSTAQLARGFEDLIGWLTRESSFPDGAFLLTGTGIVPGDDFTLAPGDRIEITIEPIGTLANHVVQG